MSDTTPNNSGSNPEKKSEYDKNTSDKFEFLSAFIDNEIKSAEENETIKKRIESEPDIHNRYTLNTHSSITTNKNPNLSHPNFTNPNYTNQFQNEKTNLKRYLIYGGYALIALVIMSFAISYYLRSNSELQDNPSFAENDIVSVSRSIFNKVESGQVKTQFNSNSAKELEDSMNKYVDFKVFVPDVKDAELIGGVCNEINGEKLAHFIHKKGNMIIYTLQANLKDVMNHDRIIMCKDFKDNVVCSSVAHMDSNDISAILTNYK